MWIRRTSRGRRDLPLSCNEVPWMCAGGAARADPVVAGAVDD